MLTIDKDLILFGDSYKLTDKISLKHPTIKEIIDLGDKYYEFLSEVVHPNLKSFEARYGKKDLSERVGLHCLFGGLMSDELGHVAVIRVLQTVLSALRILGVIIHDESGSWEKEYQQISERCDEIVDNL